MSSSRVVTHAEHWDSSCENEKKTADTPIGIGKLITAFAADNDSEATLDLFVPGQKISLMKRDGELFLSIDPIGQTS